MGILNRDGSTKELAVYRAGGSEQGLHAMITTEDTIMGGSNVHDLHECFEIGKYCVTQTNQADPGQKT